jgi:predicted nucleotidyltransferase
MILLLDDLLAIRDQERSGLLSRIVNHLNDGQRVCAAWLSGSVSRGDHDGLSDLDLSVVATDESVSDLVDARRAHAARPARPVLVMDNVAKAPPCWCSTKERSAPNTWAGFGNRSPGHGYPMARRYFSIVSDCQWPSVQNGAARHIDPLVRRWSLVRRVSMFSRIRSCSYGP